MGTVFRHRHKYYVNFRDQYGGRHREAVGTSKRMAEAALRKREAEVIEGKFALRLKRNRARLRFEDFAEEWLDKQCKPNNSPSEYRNKRSRLRNHLIPFFKGKYLDEITRRMVADYIASKKGTIKDSTINRTVSILSKMVNDAVAWEDLSEKPAAFVKKLRENDQGFDFYSRDEAKRLLEGCDPKDYALLSCALHTGMRTGEIVALKWAEVNLSNNLITVRSGARGATKTGRVRYIPVHSRLREVLEELLREHSSEYVFASNGRMRYPDLRKPLNRAARKAGVRRLRPHDLRHTFASHFVMGGGNILSLQKILGHSDIKMTMRYAHLAPDFLRGEIGLVDFG